jgi:hypothetical protein
VKQEISSRTKGMGKGVGEGEGMGEGWVKKGWAKGG